MLSLKSRLFYNSFKQFFCLMAVFLFLFTLNSTQAADSLFIIEKLSENEKEENKNEEEVEEVQESGVSSVYKGKKIKKISFDYASCLPSSPCCSFLFVAFSNCTTTAFSFRFPYLFAHSPRYVVFGSLLFYES